MPQFTYKGRDKDGNLRLGQRFSYNIDALNAELVKEGIVPIKITVYVSQRSFWDKVRDRMQGEALHLEELSIFARQMQLLQQAGVPIIISLKQLSLYTRSNRLAQGLKGVIEHLEMGQDLATAMQQYPAAFSPLMVNIVQIGETTGHLSEAFGHLHKYLEFESHSVRQIKSAFRYPIFIVCTVFFAIIVMNVFVIPTFAHFYTNLKVELPWQTRLLIGTSNFFVEDGIYALILLIIGGYFLIRYLRSPKGKYKWHRLQLRLPVVGKLINRILLIRFSQSLAIVLNSGISVTQGLVLVKNILNNTYINDQIAQMQEAIERGVSFSSAITKITLFTPLELQILGVGEKNGEPGPALVYIGDFHGQEITYDLKRMSDLIGPILISVISILILIISLGVYLPIWNMINLVHS